MINYVMNKIQENEEMVEELVRQCRAADLVRRQRERKEVVN